MNCILYILYNAQTHEFGPFMYIVICPKKVGSRGVGNDKRRTRQAAIASCKKPQITTRESGESRELHPRNQRDFGHFMPNGLHLGLLLISYL